MGRGIAARTPGDARGRHDGLPWFGARRPPAQAGRDECIAARNGIRTQLRPMQPRPPDLRGAEAHGHRAAVRAKVKSRHWAEEWLPGNGLEPSTGRETTVCSTTELPGNTHVAVRHFR